MIEKIEVFQVRCDHTHDWHNEEPENLMQGEYDAILLGTEAEATEHARAPVDANPPTRPPSGSAAGIGNTIVGKPCKRSEQLAKRSPSKPHRVSAGTGPATRPGCQCRSAPWRHGSSPPGAVRHPPARLRTPTGHQAPPGPQGSGSIEQNAVFRRILPLQMGRSRAAGNGEPVPLPVQYLWNQARPVRRWRRALTRTLITGTPLFAAAAKPLALPAPAGLTGFVGWAVAAPFPTGLLGVTDGEGVTDGDGVTTWNVSDANPAGDWVYFAPYKLLGSGTMSVHTESPRGFRRLGTLGRLGSCLGTRRRGIRLS